MSTIQIHMLGKFEIIVNNQPIKCFHCHKVLELFCFLILFCDRPHNRDQLADLFWGEHTTTDSKKYLRKTIWQLKSTLNKILNPGSYRLIEVDQDWLRFTKQENVWIDLLEFTQFMSRISGIKGEEFDDRTYQEAQMVERLYRGDLLEGCYHDWCLIERERIKASYISIVDKLTAYCEANSSYDQGINYSRKLIEMDPSNECAYQHMIRLLINSGDRISALRMFEACQKALRNEFNVEPGKETLNLYKLINKDCYKLDYISDEPTLSSFNNEVSYLLYELSEIKKAIITQDSEQRKIIAKICSLEEKLLRP